MSEQVILLPGGVLPKDLAYADLIAALGDDVDAVAKDLEVYATDEPPADYRLELEIDGVLREADAAGFERFHLAGYSGGGAVAAALAARHPDRLVSLTLLEPAWVGNREISPGEEEAWAEFDRIRDLDPDEMMRRFVRIQLAPGVEPPPPPPGPPPPWMAKRPAGIGAMIAAFRGHDLDPQALRELDRPVLFALGGRSSPTYYGGMAQRLGGLFADFTVEVFPERHHFDPPHRAEPERLATLLREHWRRAGEPSAAERIGGAA